MCNFANKPVNVQFRLAGTLTLVLTSVAYKLMLSNSLPTISYLTLVVSNTSQQTTPPPSPNRTMSNFVTNQVIDNPTFTVFTLNEKSFFDTFLENSQKFLK